MKKSAFILLCILPSLLDVSKTYIDNYLLKQKENEIYTPVNIQFLADFLQSSRDNAFHFLYNHTDKIDMVMKTQGFTWNLIDPIIEREEINQRLYKDGHAFQAITDKPDWTEMQHKIKSKYNSGYADRVVLWAKIKWSEHKKDWTDYTKYVIEKVEKYGAYVKIFPYVSVATFNTQSLNYCAWEIFTYSTNPQELKKALDWSDKVIKALPEPNANYLDTYANLLYKLGRTEEALNYEEKAFALNPNAKDIIDNLAKIKRGEPTWPMK
ncbi:MAG TPA: hypothetical protein VK518_23705 [Puia sp.]|nr:hypothetical protein [Puia sp.]